MPSLKTCVGLVLITLLLASCGRSTVVRREAGVQPARSTQPATRPASRTADEVVVARGDTLYGIAFRQGLDYRDVASWNGIRPPYTIYPGQRIRLTPGPGQPATGVAGRAPPPAPPAGGAQPAQQRPPAATPSQPPSTPAAQTPPAATPPAQPRSEPAVATGPVAWRWPADGQIVTRFQAGDSTRQGIAIAGQSGQEVRAAADGVVVYSGSGLVGYGELVIVKHTDEWLSAYGHNRRRLVEEGESVRGGQQIAEMGRSGASRDMLHFEIRRNGRPVDPLQHLPRR